MNSDCYVTGYRGPRLAKYDRNLTVHPGSVTARHVQTCSDMGPHYAGTPPPGHMLELVLYEARTVGERAVRILLGMLF